MTSPEIPPAPTPPPAPTFPEMPGRSSPSAFGTLALVAGPGLAILLFGLALGRGGQDIAIFLILVIGVLGSLIGGIFAGTRLANSLAKSQQPTILASVGCCLLCMVVSALLSFGGCAVGVLSSLRIQ